MATVVSPEPFTHALLVAVALVLLIRLLDQWEREPLWMIAFMALWGALGATAIAGPGNRMAEDLVSPDTALLWGPVVYAPIIEEVAKGVVLLLALLVSLRLARRFGLVEFDGPVDGMVYGAAVGLGFAFAENNVQFVQKAWVEGVGAGFEVLEAREGFLNLNTLSHAVYTGCLGAGLGWATWSRTGVGRVAFPLMGLAAGVLMHIVHNGVVTVVLLDEFGRSVTLDALADRPLPDEIGPKVGSQALAAADVLEIVDYCFIAAFFLALLGWVLRQRRILVSELRAEAEAGTISHVEARVMSTYGRRVRVYARLSLSGHLAELRSLRYLHRRLAELAFLKWRVRRTGGDASSVRRLRKEIAVLREERAEMAAVGL